MTDATTMERTETKPVQQDQDMAPLSNQQQLGKATGEMDAGLSAPSKQQGLLHLEPTKRKKTWGEKVFNFITYAGVALVGNEAASLVITKSIDEGARFHNAHRWFSEKFENLSPKLPRYIVDKTATSNGARLPFLLVATIGGMLMVPFVKYLEDHKGAIVRWLDRRHYGEQRASEPTMAEAHKEMDDAPKQTWGSLGKGRVITVAAAAAADATFGWGDALTTKIAPNSWFRNYSSLDRLATTISTKLMNAFSKDTAGLRDMNALVSGEFKQGRDAAAQKLFKKEFAATSTGKWFERIQMGTWLLTLSSTLTVLFYISSKIFAKRHEQKLERELHNLNPNAPDNSQTPEQMANDAIAKAQESSKQGAGEKPEHKVSAVSLDRTVAEPGPIAHSV